MDTLPKLVVFDLDFTLWNAGGTWCDHLNPPFKLSHNKVTDSYDSEVKLYPDIYDILEFVDDQECQTAVASRTYEPSWAKELLELFDLYDRFDYHQIFPSTKIKHFENLKVQSGFDYHQMLFFDDEMRNIHDVNSLGAKAIYVENGTTWELFHNAFSSF